MRVSRIGWALAVAGVLGVGACDRNGRGDVADAVPISAAGSAAAAAPPVVHGNHDPKYGGVVLMNGDLHFEVVLAPGGRYQVYFSDAARAELPASVASQVALTVKRTSGPAEDIALHIDEAGESWIGTGAPVKDPATTVRVAYTMRDQPYWIDVPFFVPKAATVSR